MLKKKNMAYVHQLLDQPSQWQTSQQAGPCSVPKFTNTSITVKHLLIKNKNIYQSKSSLLIYLFLFHIGADRGLFCSFLFVDAFTVKLKVVRVCNVCYIRFVCTYSILHHMSPVKRICVFEHSVMTNFNVHAQPFRGARDLAFCLKVPLDSLLI